MFEISTVRQLLHEFAICVSLSFTIVLAVIHTLLQLPLSLSYLAPTQLQIHWLSPTLLRITESHACPLTVLKATVACTVLVFAGAFVLPFFALSHTNVVSFTFSLIARRPRDNILPRETIGHLSDGRGGGSRKRELEAPLPACYRTFMGSR
jgi:hypothetical protein